MSKKYEDIDECAYCEKLVSNDTNSKRSRYVMFKGAPHCLECAEEKAKTIDDIDFAYWAFGDAWDWFANQACDAIDLLEAWNITHGHVLLIDPDEEIYKSISKMKQLYKEHLDEEAKESKRAISNRRNRKPIKCADKGSNVASNKKTKSKTKKEKNG